MSSARSHLCLNIQAEQPLRNVLMHYHVGPVATASVPLQLQLLSPIASIRCLLLRGGKETCQPSVAWERNTQSQVFNSEVIWDAWMYRIAWWQEMCYSVYKTLNTNDMQIMLYQFIKNTSSNQPVVLRQPSPYFSPQIHLNKSFMTEKEKQRLVGGGSMSNRNVWDIFY